MARFVFKLEGVLKQRRFEERQKQRELAVRQAHLGELQQQLKRLNEQVQTANEDMRANRLIGPLDLAFLAAHRRFLAAMQRGAIEVVQRIALAQKQVDEALAHLADAAKRRKTIEKLREKQFERWKAEQERREAAEIDEVGMQLAYRNLVADDLEGGGT